MTQDEYLKNQEDQFNPQLMQLKASKLMAAKKARDEGISSLNEQRDQQLPTYTTNANAVDARAAQNIQRARENMAANNMYRSGTMVSDTAMLNNQAASDIAQIGRDKTNFLNGINTKIGQLNQGYNDEERNAESEYAANLQAARAKALENWNTMEEQRQQAATRRSGSGAPSAYDKNAMANKIYATLDNMANNHASRSELLDEVWRNEDAISQAGLNINDIVNNVKKQYTWDRNQFGWWNTADPNSEEPTGSTIEDYQAIKSQSPSLLKMMFGR